MTTARPDLQNIEDVVDGAPEVGPPVIVAGTKYVINTTLGRKLIMVVVAGDKRALIRKLRAAGKCWTSTEWVSVEGLRVRGLRCPDAKKDRDLLRLAAKVPA